MNKKSREMKYKQILIDKYNLINKEYSMNKILLSLLMVTICVLNGIVSVGFFDDQKKYYEGMIQEMTIENVSLRSQLSELRSEGMQVTVTMYHPVARQTDSTPNILADGTRIRVHKASDYKFIAVSRNLLKRYGGWLDFGDFVFVNGTSVKDGVYQVRDVMNKRFVNRIDILESPGTKPYKFVEAKLHKTDLKVTPVGWFSKSTSN